MKPRDLFGVGLRLLGVLFVVLGVVYGSSALITLLSPSVPSPYSAIAYAASGLVCLCVGLYFLRGAPLVMRFAYSEDHQPHEGRKSLPDDS
jgi:hypothetical protein